MFSKKIAIFLGIFPCLLLVYIFIMYITTIHNLVEKGEAYGFTIGDSKEKTYQKCKKTFAGEKVYIMYPLDSWDLGPHKEFNFLDNEYLMIADRDMWEFYYSEDNSSSLTLCFKNKVLITILRFRKYWELP